MTDDKRCGTCRYWNRQARCKGTCVVGIELFASITKTPVPKSIKLTLSLTNAGSGRNCRSWETKELGE